MTNSPRFHAHASLAVDDQDRLWIAYDETDENWGKDFGLLFEGGTCLYAGRRIRFAILDKGTWLEPRDDLNERLLPGDQVHLQRNFLASVVNYLRTFVFGVIPSGNSGLLAALGLI